MVREFAYGLEPEHAGKALQRMGRSKKPIHEIRVDLTSAVALILELAQILEHAIENLFGLGYELVIVAGKFLAFLALRTGALGGHGELTLFAMSGEEVGDHLAEHLGVEGLDEIRIRTQSETLVTIPIGALCRNDHQGNFGVFLVVSNE